MKREVFWKNPGYRGYPSLKHNIDCKYLIVGGGVVGVSLAYFLARRGIKDIVLIEEKTVASGATGRAAGMLVVGMERVEIAPFLKRYGKKKSLIYWAAQFAALLMIRNTIKKEKIDCDADFEPYYVLGRTQKNAEAVHQEYIARKALHQRVKLLIKNDLVKEFGGRGFREGERIHWEISLNPLKYTQNLSRAASRLGARIFEHTKLKRQVSNTAVTSRGIIRFQHIIYAMDAYTKNRDIANVLTTIAVTKPIRRAMLKRLHMRPEMFEDTEIRDYHYAKLMKNGRLLVGYGDTPVKTASHTPRLHPAHLRNLKRFMQRTFPDLDLSVDYAWSGIVAGPKPWLPIVRFGKNKTIIAGAGTQVFGTMLARYAANHLTGRKQPLDQLFLGK